MIDHVIIMAASSGRRMEPLTKMRPKAMLPILGMPMIARVMDRFYHAGIRHFTVVVGENEGEVAVWLSTMWHQDVQIEFVPRQHQRGTASTLFAARHLIKGHFLIAACDNLLPEKHIEELLRYFDSHPSDEGILSLFYAPDEAAQIAGILRDPRGQVIYISEEPVGAHQEGIIALPVYGFTPKILAYLDKVPIKEQSGERVLSYAIQLMIDDGLLVGAIETPERIRLDTPEDLLNANLYLMADQQDSIINSRVPFTTKITAPVYIERGVIISSNTKIGPNVYLEKGTILGQGTSIENAVVLGNRIRKGTTISGEIVAQDV